MSNFDTILEFFKDNYLWLVPLVIGFSAILFSKAIRIRNFQIQKGGREYSKNILVGRDILYKSRKDKKIKHD